MKKFAFLIAGACLAGTAAQADTYSVVINQGVQEVANPTGGGGSTYAYDDLGERNGGGSTAVTTAQPRNGNGSLEIRGDRSRYVIGNIYENVGLGDPEYTGPGVASPSLTLLKDIDQLTWDWQVTSSTASQRHAAPAVRLHIMDNGIRSEMIWEWANNGGTSGVAAPAGWQTVGPDTTFYLNIRDGDGAAFLAQNGNPAGLTVNEGTQGLVFLNGGQVNNTIEGWKSYFSDNAYVTGLSFGAGSGFGSGFVGFVDNVAVTRGDDTFVGNFEVAAPIPEPATWAMMIGGFGLVGGAMRRRRTSALASA